jgi:hypothetical protein
MFSVSLKVLGINEAMANIRQIESGVNNRMLSLGDATVIHLQKTISSSAKRGSTGALGKAIKRYEGDTGTLHWVGIGKYDELPRYWHVVNYGTRFGSTSPYVPPANLGFFPGHTAPNAGKRPSGNAKGEAWTHTGSGSDFFMKPSKPIRPMNYIETTLAYIASIWANYFSVGAVRAVGNASGKGLGQGGMSLGK